MHRATKLSRRRTTSRRPDRSQVQIIDRELPAGLTDPAASAAYDQGYLHMLDAAWFAAIAAYDEAIRIQPEVAGLYEARGTAYMYASRHGDALADYSLAIELDPTDAGLWRRRSYANTIAPTPRPQKGVEDATSAIELDPDHAMGYGQRTIALTQLPTPDWDSALADMDRHIELFQGHDPKSVQTARPDTRKPWEPRGSQARPTIGPLTDSRADTTRLAD